MSLYDDIDSTKSESRAPGWGSSNMKLLQSQLKLRKAAVSAPRPTQQRRGNTLAPVIDLQGKRGEDDAPATQAALAGSAQLAQRAAGGGGTRGGVSPYISFGADADSKNEYDPLRPNDYEKVMKELRRKKEQDRERERREKELLAPKSGGLVGNYSDDEAEEEERKRKGEKGAAIAPPSILQDRSSSPPNLGLGARSGGGGGGGGSIAQQIMAKYGYKQGQGLGKAGQGIARALAVEKTSKRGGRIINEHEQAPAPLPLGVSFAKPASPGPELMPPPPPPKEPTMAEILRNPTKVVMLRNMVGAGEVDDELEGETKEECTNKYGEVARVIIVEMPNAPNDTEAVRIFVEFKRIENAIKAVVDLNGRFFGGRQVKARFYQQDRYDDLELTEHVV